MNVYTFTGRLARDCETRFTQGGMAICNFTVAVDYGFGDNKGTNWVRCALFGKRAEGRLPQYLVKGTQVAVSGELRVREYTDNDGNKRTSVEANVDALDLIGGQPGGGQGGGGQGGNQGSNSYGGGNQGGGSSNNFPTHGGGGQAPAGNNQVPAGNNQSRGNDPFDSKPAFGDVPVDDDIPF